MFVKLSKLPRFVIVMMALLVLGGILSSCGNSDSVTSVADKCDPSPNPRVVSVSPTATEMLFAIGAGSLAVAVDEFSTYPPEAPRIEGLSGFTPNVEAILQYSPDLVLTLSNQTGDEFSKLEEFDVCVLRLPAVTDLEGTYDQLRTLGRLTEKEDEANELIDDLKKKVEEIVQTYSSRERLTYFYELDPSFYTITENTFIGHVLGLLKLQSIAPVDNALGDYPQLNQEAILTSNPDIIMLADVECCGESAQTVSKRSGWQDITAVKEDKILEIDADIASRWGPRLVDLMILVGNFLEDKFN